MKNLQERVEKMLEGETKRRETALKWLQEIESILIDVAEDIWGSGISYYGDEEGTYTVDLVKTAKNGKKEDSGIYYRYRTHNGENCWEDTGFLYEKSGYNFWGKPVENVRGKEFWYAIQIIIDWLPQVVEAMDKREESREKLLQKINLD